MAPWVSRGSFDSSSIHDRSSSLHRAYMLVVKEAMPDPATVGTLFGLANAAFCLGEGTAPAIAS